MTTISYIFYLLGHIAYCAASESKGLTEGDYYLFNIYHYLMGISLKLDKYNIVWKDSI
jgi:hypothetical protein